MKKILAILCLIACAAGAQIPGTMPVSGPIAPYSLTNTYPSHISKYGKGGYMTVASSAERDAIPAERREAGMMVAVAGGGTFQLGPDLTNWAETVTVDARNFGAVPNNPVSRQDSSGSSASSGIQAAVDYVASRGGGVVRVPAGSWMISAPINVKPRVHLVGEGTAYAQAYETNALYLSGATRFYPAPGSTQDMVVANGYDASALSAPVTVFTSGDLSVNTNYNHGGAIRGISFDSGYTGLRGRAIYLNGVMGFTIDDVAFAPYGTYYPIYVWACNGVHIRGAKGLTRYPILLDYSADCEVSDCFVGGNYGPTLWVKGAKAVVSGNKFFNSQAQGNSVRPTFTANATTDTITLSDTNIGKQWFDTFPLTVELVSGAVPGGLTTNTIYYAVRVSDTDFKLHTRRDRNAGGTSGALQGGFIDISDAGSGTFNIGPGPVFNLLVDQYDHGSFVGNQLDQSYGDGLGLWSAYNNSFVGNAITEHGWNAASSDYSAVRLIGSSLNNQFIGNIIGNRSSSSHGAYGLSADSGSTNNMWIGQVTGVTNVFGANPNVWFVPRWNYADKRLEVYNSGWRTIATLDPGIAGVSYVAPGYMEMVAPTNSVPAARFTSIAGSETVNLMSYAVSAGQGAGLSSYAHRGTPGSPSQVLAGDELFEWLGTAYGTNGYVFSIASLGAITAGPVLPGNAPTRLFGSTSPTNSSTRQVRWITYENGATEFGNGGLSFASAAPSGTALKVTSTTGLFVPPVMTTTERNAISSPPSYGILGNSTSGQLEWYTGSGWTNLGAGGGGGGGSGTVTSVGLSAPSWLTVGGSPVTTSGTLALTATSQTSNTFLAGPVSGAASASAFRALHANDFYAITNLTIESLSVTNLSAETLVIQTNRSNAGVFTNSLTLNGTTITSWQSPGTGDVVGPSSASDNAIARFDTTTGKLVQNSVVMLSDAGAITGVSSVTATNGITAGSLAVSGAGAGSITLGDSAGTNGWTITSPSSVTSTPRLTLPGAAGNGVLVATNNGTNIVAKFIAHPGANGKVLISTNTPAQGFIFGDIPAGGGSSVTANGSTTVTNIADSYAAKVTMTGGTAKFAPVPPVSLTDAATVATDASLGTTFILTIGGNRTLGAPTNPTHGQRATWVVIQDSTGGRSLTADTGAGGWTNTVAVSLPAGDFGISTNAGSVTFISGMYLTNTAKWYPLGVNPQN